jgi:toxin YoeB
MNLQFSSRSWDEYLYWQQVDKRVVKRIHELLKDVARNPYQGIGKPEPLKHALAGFWSRRINDEHRLVYRVEGEVILIAQLRYHYE